MQVLLVLGLAALAAAAPAAMNIVQVADSLGCKTLLSLVERADLRAALEADGDKTLFAPTDDAFAMLPKWLVDRLTKDKEALQAVLKYHVIAAKVLSSQIKNEETVMSLEGAKLRTNIYQDGSIITVSGSKVSSPDHMASNGVVHLLDRVILPIPTGDVVSLLESHEMFFKTLIDALKIADLVDVLKGDGPFTVFAPNDEAFNKIPKDQLDKILADKELLTSILKYHVVSGTQYSAGLKDKQEVDTLEDGKKIVVSISDDGVMINKAKVIVADMSVTNGVVHVIDQVLGTSK